MEHHGACLATGAVGAGLLVAARSVSPIGGGRSKTFPLPRAQAGNQRGGPLPASEDLLGPGSTIKIGYVNRSLSAPGSWRRERTSFQLEHSKRLPAKQVLSWEQLFDSQRAGRFSDTTWLWPVAVAVSSC